MLARLTVLATLLATSACAADLPETPEGFSPETTSQPCLGKCDGGHDIGHLPALPHATLATRFAPYEDPLSFDLTLVEQVVAARRADPADYAEGANPYSIRYAVYNLRNLELTRALADAEDAGVNVQVLIEADQLDPARDWNVTDEMLAARGFEVVADYRDLDTSSRRTADLIGITGSGLMHLKTRLYSWRDPDSGADLHRVVSGSMNPGDLAVNNDETLHLIDDPRIYAAYAAKYDAVLGDEKVTNSFVPGAPLNVLFSPDGGDQARDQIAELIDREQELILLAVYSLRDVAPSGGGDGILERLVAAHQRGVTVVVVTDQKQSDGIDSDGNQIYWNDPSEETLRDAGIPVYEVINHASQFNAMHAKYGIFGLTHPIVVTDAGNWTHAGLGSGSRAPKNDESVLFIDTVSLDGGLTANRYLGNFVEILHRYGAGDVADELAGLPAWPAVNVVATARAETYWGQSLWLTGSTDELGDWTRNDAFGWPLSTDASTYPSWVGAPLSLPLGSRADYKLVERSGSDVTWEAGGNRWLVADPTDVRMIGDAAPGLALDLDLTWR